jgi:hypothetical protein
MYLPPDAALKAVAKAESFEQAATQYVQQSQHISRLEGFVVNLHRFEENDGRRQNCF